MVGGQLLEDPTSEVPERPDRKYAGDISKQHVSKRRMSYVEQAAHVITKRLWDNAGRPDVDPTRLAAVVGTGPRQVGAIMRVYGSNVTWWRVTNATGDLPSHLRQAAFVEWAVEGIEVKPNALGCRIRDHRADLTELAAAWEAAVAALA